MCAACIRYVSRRHGREVLSSQVILLRLGLLYDDFLRKIAQTFKNALSEIDGEYGFAHSPDFEKTTNLLNGAVSRAQRPLHVVGSRRVCEAGGRMVDECLPSRAAVVDSRDRHGLNATADALGCRGERVLAGNRMLGTLIGLRTARLRALCFRVPQNVFTANLDPL
jgi:hypothetical protein